MFNTAVSSLLIVLIVATCFVSFLYDSVKHLVRYRVDKTREKFIQFFMTALMAELYFGLLLYALINFPRG